MKNNEMSYKQLVNQDWFSFGKCIECDFKTIELTYSIEFPTEYKKLITISNGGERQFKTTYFQLWPIETIIERNESYQVTKYLPEKVICFANDGDLGWFFNYNESLENPKIYLVPLDDLDIKSMKFVADDFNDFINKLINNEIDTYS